ncbi:hypothetical protein B0T16DRAFT_51210 [Cercophora newfieldiana]|uniref:Integral membrane protein n=1 Tax=Cercophora newfieldiana TaxID=92897 RepID=A0AA39YR27_9PEZI|nr:hypothetical protein B0T16DRAFT_51210 [Cercophora newfieldiana]
MATTTVFDAASLPTCLPQCGVLYDVNGACAAPGIPDVGSCFCNDPRLAPFKTGITGVCAQGGCTNTNDLSSIQGWFTNFCGNQAGVVTTTGGAPGQTAGSSGGGGGGGTWLSTHYQWVIFLVIMVVAIVGIWVGACVWRKRYLRTRDRQYALGTNLAHATESGRVVPNSGNDGDLQAPSAGMFDPAPISSAGVYNEKPRKEKKKWTVKQRT